MLEILQRNAATFLESSIEIAGGVAFASLSRTSPKKPSFGSSCTAYGRGDRTLFAFGGRLDNRNDLARAINQSPDGLSDTRLMMLLFEQVGERCFDLAVGDFVVAVWQQDTEALILYRAPFATCTLFYYRASSFMAFASAPQQLLALNDIPHRLDLNEAARLAAGFGRRMEQTLFAGIAGVSQGCLMRIRQSGSAMISRPWNPFDIAPRRGNIDDLADELRQRFEEAVSAALRRSDGGVASQLSAGRDSAAVTVVAARLLAGSGERLTALTAAPPSSFAAEDPLRLSDESGLAGEVAKYYPNIDHRVCRPSGDGFLATLRRHHRFDFAPNGNPANLPWWSAMNEAAAAAGAEVILEGSLGNDTISAGGVPAFGDFARERGFVALPTFARMLVRPRGFRRRTVLKQLIGPWLSRGAFDFSMRFFRGGATLPLTNDMLREPYRSVAFEMAAGDESDERPTASYRQQRSRQLLAYEPADTVTQRLYGLDPRDPTADRRLVEFCLSLPAAVLVATDGGRPLYERAFREDLPPALIDCRRRGFQAANWIDMFPAAMLRDAFRQLHANPAVNELLDPAAIEARLDRWPSGGGHHLENLTHYRQDVLNALAVADFIDTHFPA